MFAKAIYDTLAADGTLIALLASYKTEPAVFTIDPAPGDAVLPYIVATTVPVANPFDSKTTRGRLVWVDVRCYAAANGSSQAVEAIAERVRVLLHRAPLLISGHIWLWSECSGPISADEEKAYGRILTVKIVAEEL